MPGAENAARRSSLTQILGNCTAFGLIGVASGVGSLLATPAGFMIGIGRHETTSTSKPNRTTPQHCKWTLPQVQSAPSVEPVTAIATRRSTAARTLREPAVAATGRRPAHAWAGQAHVENSGGHLDEQHGNRQGHVQ